MILKRLSQLKLHRIDPYLIIKYANQELFTSVAKNNKNYLNWNDSFKIMLLENEGISY